MASGPGVLLPSCLYFSLFYQIRYQNTYKISLLSAPSFQLSKIGRTKVIVSKISLQLENLTFFISSCTISFTSLKVTLKYSVNKLRSLLRNSAQTFLLISLFQIKKPENVATFFVMVFSCHALQSLKIWKKYCVEILSNY